jgi:hypothetical protein
MEQHESPYAHSPHTSPQIVYTTTRTRVEEGVEEGENTSPPGTTHTAGGCAPEPRKEPYSFQGDRVQAQESPQIQGGDRIPPAGKVEFAQHIPSLLSLRKGGGKTLTPRWEPYSPQVIGAGDRGCPTSLGGDRIPSAVNALVPVQRGGDIWRCVEVMDGRGDGHARCMNSTWLVQHGGNRGLEAGAGRGHPALLEKWLTLSWMLGWAAVGCSCAYALQCWSTGPF